MDLEVPCETGFYTHRTMHLFRHGHIGSLLLHQQQIQRGFDGPDSLVIQEGLQASSLQALISWSTDNILDPRELRQ